MGETEEAKRVAAQLRKPAGEDGLKMALMMNDSNKIISMAAYEHLKISDNDHILEIGMGNGAFVPHILGQASNVRITGVDYAETMVGEAIKLNKELVEAGKAEFHHAGIHEIPSEESTFTKIVTVNTMYFWDDPVRDLKELHRVLKPGGRLVIAIRPKGTVKAEFTRYNFNFYEEREIEEFFSQTDLKIDEFVRVYEREVEFDGEKFELESLFVIASK